MKKLLFLLFVSSFAYSQQGVEIRLVNPNVGTPQCNYFFNDWMCNTTNDAGLNTIFNIYGVNYFKVKGGHPYHTNTTIMAIQGDYPPQFVSDLATYSTVVAAAKFWNTNTFSDVLILTLTNSLIGMPIGVSGNIILTNDTGLSQIFQTYNVIQYSLYIPSVSQTAYILTCNCDVDLLKTALQSYSSVVSQVSNHGAAFLSNSQHEKPKALVSPNPFSDNFNIETEQAISKYSIIDITGKIIISTSSKSELVNQSSQLTAGLYILNLDFENSQKANYKLVKK